MFNLFFLDNLVELLVVKREEVVDTASSCVGREVESFHDDALSLFGGERTGLVVASFVQVLALRRGEMLVRDVVCLL